MKFLVPPENSSYTVTFGNEVIRVQLDGGVGRYRADVLNSSFTVECQWILDRTEYDYMMAFYRAQAQKGALPFTIDLVVDAADLGERTVYIIPETFKLTGQVGLAYYVSASLEVMPILNEDEATDDASTIDDYNTSQGYSP